MTPHEFPGKVQIFVNNLEVTDASIVTVTIWNSAVKEILPQDFVGDGLTLRFPRCTVFSADIGPRKPRDLDVRVRVMQSVDYGSVLIRSLLMNPTDEFTLHVIVSDFQNTVEAHGRIAGVREIKRRSTRERLISERVILFVAIGGVWGSAINGVLAFLGFPLTIGVIVFGMFAIALAIAVTVMLLPTLKHGIRR